MTRAALYARVSTTEQAPENQRGKPRTARGQTANITVDQPADRIAGETRDRTAGECRGRS